MNLYSKASLLLCISILTYTGVFYYPKWKQTGNEASISWDVSGYYLYLPSIFIYKDLKDLKFKDSLLKNYSPTPDFQQAWKHPSGSYVMKYSSGQSLFFAPFFFLAHAYTVSTGSYLPDGFSFPYQVCLGLGTLLYAFIGLWVLRKVLLHFFSDTAVALTLATITFGTNYLNYAAIDSAMTHNTLFCLYSFLLLLTIKFYRNPTLLKGLGIGCLVGWAALTRPTEIISCILPLLWGIDNLSWQNLKSRFGFIKFHWKSFGVGALAAFLILMIQSIYWFYVAGDWIIYSYGKEGFDWLRPHIINCLISYKSGWLTYSPLAILFLIGFFPLLRKYKPLFWAPFIFSCLFMYLCFAWETWWYGGSLGQRALVQSYPVLSIAMCALFQSFLKKGLLFKIFLSLLITLGVLHNIFWTHQAHRGGLFRVEEMNHAFYWKVLGKKEIDERFEHLIDNEILFESKTINGQVVFSNSLQDSTNNKLFLSDTIQFSPEYAFSLQGNYRYLRASAKFTIQQKDWNHWTMTQFIVRFYDNQQNLLKENMIRIHRILWDGETKDIMLDAKIPSNSSEAKILFYNPGSESKAVEISNLKVIVFN